MFERWLRRWLWAVFVAVGVGARGQSLPAAPCTDASKANCSAAPATPTAPKNPAQAFPFPGEEPSTADKPAEIAPDMPVKPKVAPPAYPGDPDAKSDNPGNTPSSSSSSSSGYNPDEPTGATDDPGPLNDAGSSGDTSKPGHSRRRKMPKVEAQTPESRAAEDLTVAEFYANDGNYAAAYLRAKDAVEYQPNDAYAHFALAEAAFKLGKKDEAREQYTQVLKMDPIPKQQKASEKALEELGAAPKEKP